MNKIKIWIVRKMLGLPDITNMQIYDLLNNQNMREILRIHDHIQPGDKISCSIVIDCHHDKTVICARGPELGPEGHTETYQGRFRAISASIIGGTKRK